MFANRKEKLRFILACVFSVFFLIGSVFTVAMAAEAVFSGNSATPAENEIFSVIFGTVFGVLLKLLIGILACGILSLGALAAFLAHSLRLHENPKIGKTMKILCVSDLCFLALNMLSIAILLL
ncbi:MAG: hypothetical protein IJA86_02795 [Clostridia bacterium]|nr:hypothetical protein [Clostridia bacterium]